MTQRQVLFVNDIAFIGDAISSELALRGYRLEKVGRDSTDLDHGIARYLRTLTNLLAARRALASSDLVHINYGLFGPYSALCRGKPVILHLHGSDIRPSASMKYMIANLMSRFSSGFASRVWYSTTDLADVLRSIGIEGRYMPNPVSRSFMGPLATFPTLPHVLFAIPLSRLKGAHIAAEAMRDLLRQDDRIRISCFDFGPAAFETDELRALIPDGVHRLKRLEHAQVPRLLTSASVIVGRLGIGSLGVTELEAMACGRPVIVSATPRVSKLESYYADDPPIITCNTPTEVSSKVLNLLADQDTSRRFGLEGRSWVNRYHSANQVAALYEREYSHLIDIT